MTFGQNFWLGIAFGVLLSTVVLSVVVGICCLLALHDFESRWNEPFQQEAGNYGGP